MVRSFSSQELDDWLGSLLQRSALTELAVLLGCLLLAWGLVRAWRGARKAGADVSIVFGRHVYDGVLFPVLTLALLYGAKLLLAGVVKGAVFKLAVPLLLSLALIRLSVRVLNATYPTLHWVRVLERSISWVAWLAVVLWVTGVLPFLMDAMDEVQWKVGATYVSLRNVVEGTLTTGLTLVLALWVSAVVERRLLRGAGSNLSMRKIAANVVRALLLFVGLLLACSAVGIDLTALSVLGGAIGVGLGFGLQKIAANYISGFVILAEQSLRIGDMVKVDGFEGRITDIRTRYTVVRSLNGREALVPNETLITQRIENSSLADSKISLSTMLWVAYGTENVSSLLRQIEQAVVTVPRVVSVPSPTAHLAAFAIDGMQLNVSFWIADPENGQGNVLSSVNLVVLDLLNTMGVKTPNSQRTVATVVAP